MNRLIKRAEAIGQKLENLEFTDLEKAKKILARASLSTLHYLEFWNLGWSGCTDHPFIEILKDEIRERYEAGADAYEAS